MNRKLIVAALIALASPAAAADLPVPVTPVPVPYYAPVKSYNWSSIYIGGNAGFGFATASVTDGFDTINEDGNGFVAGGQIGGNYQIGAIVLGIEGDFDWSNQSHTTTLFGITAKQSIDWIGTVRGRFGYAYDRWMFYVTAGGGEGKASTTLSDCCGSITASKTHSLWTAGVGIEYGITDYLTARIEYLYLNTGDINLATINGFAITGKVQDNLIRAGLNVRLPF